MKSVGYRVAIVASCALLYEWFVVEAIVSEAIAAISVGLVMLLAHERLVRVEGPHARIASGFLLPLVVRVLPGILRESFDLLIPTLWRSLVQRENVRGRWIALRYDPDDKSPAFERGRRTIVITGSNLTPNALPLDIDTNAGRLILHQLLARREAAASDPRYPM